MPEQAAKRRASSGHPAKASDRQRCTATRKDDRPCTALAVNEGLCVGHAPQAQEARRRGGHASARAARLGRLVPPRLLAVFDTLELAMGDVYAGEMDPRVATAMASLAGAMVRVLTAGELEDRVRRLESPEGADNGRRTR